MSQTQTGSFIYLISKMSNLGTKCQILECDSLSRIADTLSLYLSYLEQYPQQQINIDFILNSCIKEFEKVNINQQDTIQLDEFEDADVSHILNTCIEEFAAETNDMEYDDILTNILDEFETMNDNKCVDEYIFSKIGENYSNVCLLNDFNHLLFHHSSQFDKIYNELTQKVNKHTSVTKCDFSNCQMIRRNQRNRTEITKNEYLLNVLYCNSNDIIPQQLLDRIHCYYCHKFDSGDKPHEQKVNVTEESKTYSRQNVNGLNRFKTLESYSFGFRFYYWKCHSNHHEEWMNKVKPGSGELNPYLRQNWYVSNKYKSLKEELTTNRIHHIGPSQFINLVKKAGIYKKSVKVKEMFCVRKESAKCYEMFYEQSMSISHLISMMVYCNYDELQCKFTATFRKLPQMQDCHELTSYQIDRLKAKHRNFYFLAKSLIECVECFGMMVNQHAHDININVFHGINKEFSFKSMDMRIKGPFSTTTSRYVAIYFCDNQGMIWEMTIDQGWTISAVSIAKKTYLTCMDMFWISDYPNEQEIFCIGGLNKFQLYNIETPFGISYRVYIAGLRLLARNMNTDTSMHDTNMYGRESPLNEQMAVRLLSHELHDSHKIPGSSEFKDCPEYIKNILHAHCLNTFNINMGYSIIDNFFMGKNGWLKLNLITKVFPKLKSITYYAGSKDAKWLTDSSMYQFILEFLHQNKNTSLNYIDIHYNVKYKNEIKNLPSKYKDRFHKYWWTIFLKTEKFPNHDSEVFKTGAALLQNDKCGKFLQKKFNIQDVDFFRNMAINMSAEHLVMRKMFPWSTTSGFYNH
eukprot:521846_1